MAFCTKIDPQICAYCRLTNKEKYVIIYIENKKEVDVMIFIVLFHVCMITLLYVNYWKNCKAIGKNNLAVPFSERLIVYIMLFVMPTLIPIFK